MVSQNPILLTYLDLGQHLKTIRYQLDIPLTGALSVKPIHLLFAVVKCRITRRGESSLRKMVLGCETINFKQKLCGDSLFNASISCSSFKVFREELPHPNPGIGCGDRMVKEAMAHIIHVHPFPVETMVGPWIDLQDYFVFGFLCRHP
jgi:hypothetical protein